MLKNFKKVSVFGGVSLGSFGMLRYCCVTKNERENPERSKKMAIKIATIQKYEDVAAMKEKDLDKLGINPELYWGYWRAKQVENEFIDLSGCIWERDVEGIVKECRTYGVKKITISSTYSGMTELLWEFAKHGCKVVGIMQVYSIHRNYDNDGYEKVPAVIVEIQN